MISRTSKILIALAIIITLFATSFILSHFNENKIIKSDYGAVGDSQFQIESGWYQNLSLGYKSSAKLKFNGSTDKIVLMIMVNQYQSQSDYKRAYDDLSQKSNWHTVFANTETREGIFVKVIEITWDGGGETVRYYFFEKNGKYFSVLIDITSKDVTQFFASEKYKLNKTVNTIIKTIT